MGVSPDFKPEVTCPPPDAPITAETVQALRDYVRKLEIELLVAPKKEMLSLRDAMIEDLNAGGIEKDAEIRRLKEEVDDLTNILKSAATEGTVRVEALGGLLDPSLLFEVDVQAWKNKIITTLGFATKCIYMQYDKDRKLIRTVTDDDLRKAVFAENVAQMPPV